jgi:twitching motility protein PilT
MNATSFSTAATFGTSEIALSARPSTRRTLEALLTQCQHQDASDVHLTGGLPAYFRIQNDILPASDEPLSEEVVAAIAAELMTEEQRRVFQQRQQLDLAFFSADGTRYRVNVYRQRGVTALALRRLNSEFHDLHSLNLPPQLGELAEFPFGLVIVTGPTGSGKSTTLASIIHQINTTRRCHIITIEDPIEHVHRNHASLIHQRELHCDVPSFASALKAALREDPDVLLVGEMRDLDTMRAAITAAETGHLVFSTLHTGDAAGSIGRMVGAFPADEQPLVREQISRVLRAVVSQRLLARKDSSGRVPAVEIMRVNSALANLIRQGDMRQAFSIITTGADEGMLLLEQSLAYLTAAGAIDRSEALRWCRDEGVFNARWKTLTQPRSGW